MNKNKKNQNTGKYSNKYKISRLGFIADFTPFTFDSDTKETTTTEKYKYTVCNMYECMNT